MTIFLWVALLITAIALIATWTELCRERKLRRTYQSDCDRVLTSFEGLQQTVCKLLIQMNKMVTPHDQK